MISIQKIHFPADCEVVHNYFFDYDPVNEFNEADSIEYLSEDLFQCAFPKEDIIVDLGWYGDLKTNKGEFRVNIIQNENWEIPVNIINSKSVAEMKEIITKILDYYSSS